MNWQARRPERSQLSSSGGAEPEWLEQKLADLDFLELVAKPEGGRWATKGRTTVGRLWNLARFNGSRSSAPLEEWLEKSLREGPWRRRDIARAVL